MEKQIGLKSVELSMRTAGMCQWTVTVRQLSFFSAVPWPGSNQGHEKMKRRA